MSIHRKLTTAAAVAALAIGLAACSSGGSGPTAAAPGTPAPPEPAEPTEPAGPTELEAAQTAAAGAAMAAKRASDNASTAAGNAMTAAENLATMQTGGMSAGLAQEAQDAAENAMEAYTTAKSAAEDAAAATTATAAVKAQLAAEDAQADAEMYADTAVEKGTASETAAAMELRIVGTMKSVGESMVDAMALASTVTTDDQTIVTGRLVNMDLSHTVPAFAGRHGAQDNPATDANEAVAYRQAVEERSFDIGKTLDSSDDMARLMLITHYAGLKTVKTFYRGPLAASPPNQGENIDATHVAGSRAGQIFIHNGPDGTAPDR